MTAGADPARQERIESLRRALESEPAQADALGQLGTLLLEQARELQQAGMSRRQDRAGQALPLYREALERFEAAVRLRPASAQAHRLCGIVLRELGEIEAASWSFAQAWRARPDAAVATDYASSLQALGDSEGAVRVFEQALRSHPEDAGLHASFALTLLGRGEFARGWQEYEWRLTSPDAAIERPFPFPRWQGESLAGRTLLVYAEQGIGDEIMFASCFPELIAVARHCVLEVSTRLVPLFERSFPGATVFARSLERMPDWTRLPPIDLCVAAGSVPRRLRGHEQAFPRRDSYLCADATRAQVWRERLAAAGAGRKIGLAWTGGLPRTLRAARSMALRDLRALLDGSGEVFVALEFLDCTAEVDAFNRGGASHVHWWPEAVATLDETAALVSVLDLVISVTTASAHLAGALGRPTWVLVPSVPSWRYLWQGERMPWYPSMRIFRGEGSREAVVARARAALRGQPA